MKVADYIQDSVVDGPGLRFTLFVQGCPHHCEGCHNPGTHDFSAGKELSVSELAAILFSNPLTDGITFSGGEPFSQAAECSELAELAREHGLNVWAYSGWTFEQLRSSPDPHARHFLSLCDVLVDGPFVLAQRSLTLRWRGSSNQRVVSVPKSLASDDIILYDIT